MTNTFVHLNIFTGKTLIATSLQPIDIIIKCFKIKESLMLSILKAGIL